MYICSFFMPFFLFCRLKWMILFATKCQCDWIRVFIPKKCKWFHDLSMMSRFSFVLWFTRTRVHTQCTLILDSKDQVGNIDVGLHIFHLVLFSFRCASLSSCFLYHFQEHCLSFTRKKSPNRAVCLKFYKKMSEKKNSQTNYFLPWFA